MLERKHQNAAVFSAMHKDDSPSQRCILRLENLVDPLQESSSALINRRLSRHLVVHIGLILRSFLLGTAIIVMLSSCAKKIVRNAVPFEFDQVFSGVFSVPPEDWKDKGMQLAKEGNYSEAIDTFKNYVLENPESFFGFNALAVCYKNVGDTSLAMKNYERALEFADSDEDRAKVAANIGNLYFSAKKFQVALGFYKEAYSEYSQNPMYLILIARTFLSLDESSRARKVLAAAEDVHSQLQRYERGDDKGLGHYLMAQSFLALNEEDKVFQYLENALRSNPEKFLVRISQDSNDEQNLMYTIRDDLRLKRILQRHSPKLSPERTRS